MQRTIKALPPKYNKPDLNPELLGEISIFLATFLSENQQHDREKLTYAAGF